MSPECAADDCDGTGCACTCHDNTGDLMTGIFDHLEHEWRTAGRHVAGWFEPHEHHGDTITASTPPAQPAQENTMSVPDAVAALKTSIEAAASALTTVLDQDVPALEGLGSQIDNSRIIQAAAAAEAVVPQAVLDAEAAALDALTTAFTPAAVPAQ